MKNNDKSEREKNNKQLVPNRDTKSALPYTGNTQK